MTMMTNRNIQRGMKMSQKTKNKMKSQWRNLDFEIGGAVLTRTELGDLLNTIIKDCEKRKKR